MAKLQSRLEFSVSQFATELVDGALVVVLGQREGTEGPYLVLQRRHGADVQSRALGQETYFVEMGDQSQSCHGGVEDVVLHRDHIRLTFSDDASRALGGWTACTVRFPLSDGFLRPQVMLAEHRLDKLRAAVRAVFAGTSTEVTFALDKPLSGSPSCRLSARERRELGWDSVSHCRSCDHMVFLAESDADAGALGRIGQCVKRTEGSLGPFLFVGVFDDNGEEPIELPEMLSLKLPNDSDDLRAKALEGAHLYLNRLRYFNKLVARLLEGQEVLLPSMTPAQAAALRRRLEEWHLAVVTSDQTD